MFPRLVYKLEWTLPGLRLNRKALTSESHPRIQQQTKLNLHVLARTDVEILIHSIISSGSAKKFSELVNKCMSFSPIWPPKGPRFVLV